jgi:hypothetical protein
MSVPPIPRRRKLSRSHSMMHESAHARIQGVPIVNPNLHTRRKSRGEDIEKELNYVNKKQNNNKIIMITKKNNKIIMNFFFSIITYKTFKI